MILGDQAHSEEDCLDFATLLSPLLIYAGIKDVFG